jgi:hypothetical protein
MSTSITTNPPIPPPGLPLVVLEHDYDATTRAVLRYFEAQREAAVTGSAADNREHADAFDHLVAICYDAVQPFFVLDRNGSFTVEAPQFNNIDGGRTGRTSRKEGNALDATRQWIQEWLLEILAPCNRNSSLALITADAGKFRYLGRLCRLTLVDRLRSQTAKKKPRRPPHVSLDTPVGKDDTTLLDYISADGPDGPSCPLAPSLGFEHFLTCVKDVLRAVVANTEELGRLDLIDGLLSILGNAEHLERASAKQYAGIITRSLARRRGVSPTSARAYKRRFYATMVRELAAGNPAVRAVFLELPPSPPAEYTWGVGQPDGDAEK